MDGMLSQEEINALLSGMDSGSGSGSTPAPEEQKKEENTGESDKELLTPEEKDAIGEIANISMGTAATTLSSLVNNVVDITVPQVSYATWDDVVEAYDRPCVFVQLKYKDGIEGNNVLILKEQDVKIITDLMMGGDGTNTADDLTDLHLSAIGEAMNQMMGSAATSLSQMLGRKIDISPPVASLIDLNDGVSNDDLGDYLHGTFIKVTFKMTVGDLIDSELMQLYPVQLAKELYKVFAANMGSSAGQGDEKASSEQKAPEPQPAAAQPQPQQSAAPQPQPQQSYGQAAPQMAAAAGAMPYGYGVPASGNVVPPNVNAQPVQFSSFAPAHNPITQQENIDLIMDVPLNVTVELGKTKKTIKEILDISPGTIIELDKLAGEPVDVIVNGKYVARGEVVVIEENFGVRVTEILNSENENSGNNKK